MSVWGQSSRLWGGKPPPPTMTPYTSTIPTTTTTLPRLPELSLSLNTSGLLRPPPHLPSSSSAHSVQRPSLQALLNHNDSDNSESDDDEDDNDYNNNINNEIDTDTMKRRSSSSDMDDGNSSSSSDAKRKYACPSCSLTFRRTEHLLRHKLTHSGEKPYGCDICSRGFSRMDALRRHQKVHAIRPPSPTLSHLQPPPSTTTTPDSPSSSSSCASSDDGLSDDHVVLPRPTSATSIRRPHFLPSPEPAPVPRTGPSICPLRLQDLSSSPVSILANGDRVLYHCPVRGCRDMLSSDTLSHKLESLRHPDAFHQTPPTIQHANRDLLAFITHIYAHHAIPGICRDCSRTHDRSDYFSIENAPCILPFHHPSSTSTSNAIGPCASLQSILNGSAPLPPSLSNQTHQRTTTTTTSTHSDAPDDSLLRTLAQCAAQQLELESPASSSAAAAYRIRKIQDLLN